MSKLTRDLVLPSEDRYSAVVSITPGNIRQSIESWHNPTIQDTIETMMKADSHFVGKIQDRLSVVNRANMSWKPASEDARDQEILDFVKENLESVLDKENLAFILQSLFHRFSVQEIHWKLENNKYVVDRIEKTPFRAFEFSRNIVELEKEKNHLVIYDYENDTYSEIPENKTLRAFSPLRFDDRVVSITEVVAILIVIKYYALQKDWPRFNELFGLPLRVGTYESTATETDIDRLFDALKSLGSDAAAVIGGATKIDFAQPKSNSPEPFEKIINFCNDEISKAITGESGTSGDGSKTSYASMSVLNNVREDIVEDSLNLISKIINEQLIKPLVDFNYEVKAYPEVALVLPSNLGKLLDVDGKLNKLGVKFRKDYFIKRYNLNDEDFDIQEDKPADPFQMLKKKSRYGEKARIDSKTSVAPFF